MKCKYYAIYLVISILTILVHGKYEITWRFNWIGNLWELDQQEDQNSDGKRMSWKIYKKLKVKNWKETAKDRRTWGDLAEKAKTHKGL